MTLAPTPDPVAALQYCVAVQQEAIAHLRAALATSLGIGPTVFHFSPQEQAIVELLLRAEFVPHERISQRLYGARHGADAAAAGIIKVHVLRIRRKLGGRGIGVRNAYGQGYWMTRDDKAKMRAALALEIERA